MGYIADTLAWAFERKADSVGSAVPTFQVGAPQYQRQSYQKYALEGYSANEIVYACIEELATSAAEPRIAAFAKSGEKLKTHPIVDLFERPNPFLDRFAFVATIIMHLGIAGNAYVEIVRSGAHRPVEMWLLRPDRMFVVPHRDNFIGEYEYRLEGQVFRLPASDIVHIKERNPLDDYYGMPPLAVAAHRTDTDNWMREFTRSFFRNAGVPAGLLNVKKSVSPNERQLIQDRFRGDTSGPAGWHSLLVLDNTEATFSAMGMPLGERGLILPELDEIDESRIAMCFGVPLQLIGSRLGMMRAIQSNWREARSSFWDETLIPRYQMLAAAFNNRLAPEWSDIEKMEFDLSTVLALQEDEDKKHERIRSDVASGLLSLQEGRVAIGRTPEFPPGAILYTQTSLAPLPADQLSEPILPGGAQTRQLGPPAGEQPSSGEQPPTNGHTNMTPEEVAKLLGSPAASGS
jgi:HK97 family phage portal protein